LATAGLTWVLCRSKLFKSTREYCSLTYDEIEVKKRFNKPQFIGKETIFWFLTSLFSCYGCMGFWASQPIFLFLYRELSLNNLLYGFIGAIASLIIVNYSSYLERK
jgi:hypothetical protein